MARPIEPPALPFGPRLRAFRERAGKTRTVLGGLVGRSEEWVKAVETGRLQMPRLPMLLRLAEGLDVTDIAELTGDQSMRTPHLAFAEHPASPAVRDAVQRYTLTRPSNGIQPVDVVRARVDRAWQIWKQPVHCVPLGAWRRPYRPCQDWRGPLCRPRLTPAPVP